MHLLLSVIVVVVILAIAFGVFFERRRRGFRAPDQRQFWQRRDDAPERPDAQAPPVPSGSVAVEVGESDDSADVVEAVPPSAEAVAAPIEAPEPTAGRLQRLRGRLARSQSTLGRGLLAVLSRDRLDDAGVG